MKNLKILVIEDDPTIRENIEEILQLAEFQPILAADGDQGVKLAIANLPDLIICDVMMSKLDGYEVLKMLKEQKSTQNIPFIFLTAKSARGDFRHGMDLGADDYLTKPFAMDELLSAINTRMEKKINIENQTQTKLNELRQNINLSLPHELRTPLSGILGSGDLLKQLSDDLQPEDIEEIADTIIESGERLYQLIQNYLLYAELELLGTDTNYKTSLKTPENRCLTTSIIEDIAIKEAAKAERKFDLSLYLQDGVVFVEKVYFEKMLQEIINNAFKFSENGSPVKIITNNNEEVFNIFIIDHGGGMSVNEIANIGAYTQFNRKIYAQEGVGLGLTIAKRIVELSGGSFNIKSVVGQKTIVHIILPIAGF